MRRKLVIGVAVVGLACVSFFAGVLVDHRFPALFGFAPGPPEPSPPFEGAILPNVHGTPPRSFTWEFRWSEVPWADRYEVAIYNPAGLRRYHMGENSTQFLTSSEGRSVPAESLLGWSWQVRARVGGRWSKWSEARRFSVEPARP